MMFRDHPPCDRIARARAAGFDGIEVQHLDEWPGDGLAQAVADTGSSVALINLRMGDLLSGGAGLSGVPGREHAFRDAVGHGLDLARHIGARCVHLGPSRIPTDASVARCLATYRENAAYAAGAARGAGVRLVVEPMNRTDHPDVLIGDLDTAMRLVAELDGAIGLLFDTYHVAMGGHEPTRAFSTCATAIDHIQIADSPGRGPPGTAAPGIDFPAFFAAVAQSRYDGWMCAEYHPSGPTESSLEWLGSARDMLAAPWRASFGHS